MERHTNAPRFFLVASGGQTCQGKLSSAVLYISCGAVLEILCTVLCCTVLGGKEEVDYNYRYVQCR
jgi:hypothetical protein